ncbi:MAG: hypothetical protein GY754_42215 [bacterium]|nr:hypothetical protein [bacterium]
MDKFVVIKYVVMAFFIGIVPGIVIYFKLKKKISIWFAFGLVITSFVLSYVVGATIDKAEMDPVGNFEKFINEKKHDEAKRALQVVIQFGAETLGEIDTEKILYKDLYMEIKNELIAEYTEIAERYLKENTVELSDNCDDYVDRRKKLGNLKHAIKLVGFSELIEGKHAALKENLQKKVDAGQVIVSGMKEKCD